MIRFNHIHFALMFVTTLLTTYAFFIFKEQRLVMSLADVQAYGTIFVGVFLVRILFQLMRVQRPVMRGK